MKILVVSIIFGPPFQRDLMEALAQKGHQVTFYSAGLSDLTRRPRLRWQNRAPLTQVDLLNSPAVPGVTMDPDLQLGNHEIDLLTEQVLNQVKPDVVHVHELSGHGLSVLEVLARRRVPTVVSFHNYWPICPQLNLLDPAGELCEDYENGEKCTRCQWLPLASDRFFVDQLKSALHNNPLFKPASRARKGLRQWFYKGAGKFPSATGSSGPRYSAQSFAQRRLRAIEALNTVNAIHVMSNRGAEILAQYGISSELIRVIHIGSFRIDQLKPAMERHPEIPITFGYRGALSFAKGVQVMIEAFSKVDQTKARLLIYGAGEPEYEEPLRRMAHDLNVTFLGEYFPDQLPQINAGIDMGIIPSICNETFCLSGIEFLRCGVPVIATRMGGMLDYIEDGVNGLFVAPDDVDSLTEALQACVESPQMISQLRSGIRSTHTMAEALDDVLELYSEVIERG